LFSPLGRGTLEGFPSAPPLGRGTLEGFPSSPPLGRGTLEGFPSSPPLGRGTLEGFPSSPPFASSAAEGGGQFFDRVDDHVPLALGDEVGRLAGAVFERPRHEGGAQAEGL